MNGEDEARNKNGAQSASAMGTKVWAIIQKAIPLLLVSFVSFLVFDRNSAWRSIGHIEHDLERHELNGLRKHALLERSLDDYRAELDDLDDGLKECQLAQQRLLIGLAELPQTLLFPFSENWQNMILDNARKISVLKGKLEK